MTRLQAEMDSSCLSIAFTEKRLCTRCGTCVGVCPENALEVDADFYPTLLPDRCTRCGLCKQTCPGGTVPYGDLAEITFGSRQDAGAFDGHVDRTFMGYAGDERIRAGGAGGGVITALLWSLLKSKRVDGCVVTRMNPKRPWEGEVFIARTYEELLESQQSKYIIIPVNRILRELRALEGKYAVAALPCQIHGLRLYSRKKTWVNQKIPLIIGLFCASSLEPCVTKEMLETRGLKPDDIANFAFRDGEWPGFIRAYVKGNPAPVHLHHSNFKDGAINYLTYLYSPARCQTCVDGSSEFSDISVSDAWTRDQTGAYMFRKQSKLLVRTAKGKEAMLAAMAAGDLVADDVTDNPQFKTHRLHTVKKGLKNYLRADRWRAKGLPAPMIDRPTPNNDFRDRLDERLESLAMWLGRHRWCRYPVFKFLTSRWGVPIIAARQWIKSRKYRGTGP
jgi:coenzyme F420 hydrogenase subunit beta